MPTKVRIVRGPSQVKAILNSPQGGLYKDIFRRATNVQNRAKKNLERAPRRVDTGRLRSDIHVVMVTINGVPAARIGFNVFYGLYVHDGTGIYGPKGTPIFPKQAKMLRWRTKGGKYVYATSVKGMKPNPFLKDALPAARE